MSELRPCPVCGDDPKITRFALNPVFAVHGRYGYEVTCPTCGCATGNQWYDEAGAIADWNDYVNDEYEGDDDG